MCHPATQARRTSSVQVTQSRFFIQKYNSGEVLPCSSKLKNETTRIHKDNGPNKEKLMPLSDRLLCNGIAISRTYKPVDIRRPLTFCSSWQKIGKHDFAIWWSVANEPKRKQKWNKLGLTNEGWDIIKPQFSTKRICTYSLTPDPSSLTRILQAPPCLTLHAIKRQNKQETSPATIYLLHIYDKKVSHIPSIEFKPWIRKFMESHLNEQQISDFRDAFSLFDKNNDGMFFMFPLILHCNAFLHPKNSGFSVTTLNFMDLQLNASECSSTTSLCYVWVWKLWVI